MFYGIFKGNASIHYNIENKIITKEKFENLIENKIQSAGMILINRFWHVSLEELIH